MSEEPAVPVEAVLCVDLDGTLSRADTTLRSLLLLMRQRPWTMLLLPFSLRRGRAGVKAQIAQRVRFDPATLDYHDELVTWLREQKAAGRKLVIASGADERIVRSVAAHLDLFDEIFASDGHVNLTGSRKAAALAKRFGDFAYVGNSKVDVAVWRRASSAYLVAANPRFAAKLAREVAFARVFHRA